MYIAQLAVTTLHGMSKPVKACWQL